MNVKQAYFNNIYSNMKLFHGIYHYGYVVQSSGNNETPVFDVSQYFCPHCVINY